MSLFNNYDCDIIDIKHRLSELERRFNRNTCEHTNVVIHGNTIWCDDCMTGIAGGDELAIAEFMVEHFKKKAKPFKDVFRRYKKS